MINMILFGYGAPNNTWSCWRSSNYVVELNIEEEEVEFLAKESMIEEKKCNLVSKELNDILEQPVKKLRSV